MIRWWDQPLAGEIVWSYFPNEVQKIPPEKPRPALIIEVFDDDAPEFGVLVAYGTSQRVDTLYRGEFSIYIGDGDAYRAAGLSYDTKFNFGRRLSLPFNDEYFAVPPGAPMGQRPKLGVLHPSLIKRASAAWFAIQKNSGRYN